MMFSKKGVLLPRGGKMMGEELFDRIVQRVTTTEARDGQPSFQAMQYCHQHHVAHQDSENLLL
jgi:hypothetical protein